MLPVKKIYVDSKYKTPDSISDSNFKFQLPQTCFMPEDTKFFISDVCIPFSWYTVNSFNNKLYLSIFDANAFPVQSDHIIELNQQIYNGTTFAAQLKQKILADTSINLGTITCTYNATTNQISLSYSNADIIANLLTDVELKSDTWGANQFTWNGTPYDKKNLQSANAIINNIGAFSEAFSTNTPFVRHLNLQPIRNIYIHSTNLGNFNTIGARGEQTIVKKVPVNANSGEMIFSDYNAGSMDALDCSKQTLRQLHFIITNVDGIEIPFNGNHVSFSIVFNQL